MKKITIFALSIVLITLSTCKKSDPVNEDDISFKIAEFSENFVNATNTNEVRTIAANLGWVEISENNGSVLFASSEEKAKALRKGTDLTSHNAFAFPYIEVEATAKSTTVRAYDALHSQTNGLNSYKLNALWCHGATLRKYVNQDWLGIIGIYEGSYYQGKELEQYKGVKIVLGNRSDYFKALKDEIFIGKGEDEVAAMEWSFPQSYNNAGYLLSLNGGETLIATSYYRLENR